MFPRSKSKAATATAKANNDDKVEIPQLKRRKNDAGMKKAKKSKTISGGVSDAVVDAGVDMGNDHLISIPNNNYKRKRPSKSMIANANGGADDQNDDIDDEDGDLFKDETVTENSVAEGSNTQKKAKKPKRSRLSKDSEEGSSSRTKQRPGTIPSHGLSFKKLHPGLTVLAVVRDVQDLEITMSLPDGLVGFVPITEVSTYVTRQVEQAATGQDEENDDDDNNDDEEDKDKAKSDADIPDLDSLVSPGMVLSCVIVSVGGAPSDDGATTSEKRVELSFRPERVNGSLTPDFLVPGMALAASVASIEDHGYILDLGLSKGSSQPPRGFLHKKNTQNRTLVVGQPILCSVLSMDSGKRTVSLTLAFNPTLKSAENSASSETFTLSSVRAGTLMPFTVAEANPTTLSLTTLGFSPGIFASHVSHQSFTVTSDKGCDSFFKKGDKGLIGRVLFVDETHKRVGVTFRKALVELPATGEVSKPSDESAQRGTIWKDAVCVRVDEGVGIVLRSSTGLEGYVHISRIADSPTAPTLDAKKGKYAIGTKHSARILGWDLCDGLARLSTKPSVLSAPFLRRDEIKAGTIVKGKVSKVDNFGIVVMLTDSIHGLVPKAHLAEAMVSDPSKRFKVGALVKCRVLVSDASQKRLLLTMKRPLVSSTLPCITSYNDAQVGMMTDGYIRAIKDFGCIVGFYNDVRAVAPLSELSERFIKNAADHFTVGQAIKCLVTSVDAAAERMNVSFKRALTNDAPSATSISAAGLAQINPGDIITGSRVISILPEAMLVELQPSLARGILHKHHLTDWLPHADGLFKGMAEGMVFENLVVLEIDEKRGRAIVSAKPLLIEYWKKQLQKSAGGLSAQTNELAKWELQVGNLLPGFVKGVSESKCFVAFIGGAVGITKVHSISDAFVTKATNHMQIGQTVIALVTGLDTANDTTKPLLSLKASQTSAFKLQGLATSADLFALRNYFKEEDTLQMSALSSTWPQKYAIGKTVKGVVVQKAPYGVIVKVDDDVSGLVTLEGSKAPADVKKGDELICRVVDADIGKKILDLRVTSSDQSESVANVAKLAKKAFEAQEVLEAVIEVVKTTYLVLSIPTLADQIVYSPSQPLNVSSETSAFPKHYKAGQKLKVVLGSPLPEKSAAKKLGFVNQRVLVSIGAHSASTPKKQNDSTTTLDKHIVKGAIDESVSSMQDVTSGTSIKGRVQSIKPLQLNVVLGSNLKGRVHISELASDLSKIKDPKKPWGSIKVSDIMTFKVVSVHRAIGKSGSALAITQAHLVPPAAKSIVELTLREEDIQAGAGKLVENSHERRHPDFASVEVGSVFLGFLQKVADDCLWAAIGPHVLGRVRALEASQSPESANNLSANFVVGQAVPVMVLSKNESKCEVNLSIRGAVESGQAGGVKFPVSLETLKINDKLVARITKIVEERGLTAQLADGIYGRISLSEISDSMPEHPLDVYKVGDHVLARVASINLGTKSIELTLRSTKNNDFDFETNQLVTGYVKNISDAGVFVDVGKNTVARVKIADLSDDYVKDWKSLVKVGSRVVGRILSVNETSQRLEVSLKESAIDPSVKPKTKSSRDDGGLKLEDVSKGMKVSGTIKSIESYGVFIKIDNSRLSGLCHISEVSDKPVVDLASLYSPGDAVMAKILKLDLEKKRISFGLKSSYFTEVDAVIDDQDDEDDDDEDEDMEDQTAEDDGDDGDDVEEDMMAVDEDEEDENEAEDDEEEDGDGADVDDEDDEGDDEEADDNDVDDDNDELLIEGLNDDIDDGDELMDRADGPAAIQEVEPLDIDDVNLDENDDTFDDYDEEMDDADSDDNEAKESSSKKSKRAKKREKKEAEARVAKQEAALLSEQAPDSAESFERLLMGSPNSSYLWIKFMAFHLQMAEITKAREVAEKALKTISFREPQELMNIWVAMLNLENTYGDAQSLTKVFERALQYNNPKTVYIQLSQIYERTSKFEEAENLYKAMTKRFKESCKVWVAYGMSLLKRGKMDQARNVLHKSLLSLAKRKHVKAVSKFAQMEYKYGEPERGRTLFEGIITNHPKRLDIWSIFLDMEIKNGDVDATRRLFERSITLKLSSKKIKFLFKKYLDFEKRFGTPEGVEHVKEAAMAYVERIFKD